MSFAKYIVAKFVILVWLFAALLPVAGLIWVREHYPDLLPSWLFNWVMLPLILIWIGSNWWISVATTRHINQDSELFLPAIKRAVLEFRVQLAFIPVIGRFFEPDEDKTHSDPDDE